MNFKKTPLSTDDHIALLRERNMIIDDVERTKRYLRYIGYYRLSAYFIPHQSTKDQFNDDTSFDDILNLYIFDRKLRNHVMDAMERIEVAVRAIITNYMSQRFDSHWYLKHEHFQKQHEYNNFIKIVEEALIKNRSNTSIKHYVHKYKSPKEPPSWMLMEILTFGNTSILFSKLKAKYKKNMCREFGIRYQTLEEFLRLLSVTRNKCAHHARFWNAKATQMPKDDTITDILNIPPEPNTYTQLSAIQFFLTKITTSPTWASRLKHLVYNEPFPKHVDMCVQAMGFVERWEDHELWREHFTSSR